LTDRYTAEDCRNMAKILAEELGKKFGNCWEKVGEKNRAIVGCWDISYNPIYGGCIITEIDNEFGAVSHPISEVRFPPREFFHAVNMAIRAVRITKGK